MNIGLWIVQVLLALLFLWAGGIKLVLPVEEMTKQMPVPLPGLFLRLTAVCELLGGLGLILPRGSCAFGLASRRWRPPGW